ncbi:MAG: DUF4235 domain-containing protein [Anditalea sp.]
MDLSSSKNEKFLQSMVISLSAVAAGILVKKGFDLIYEKIYRQDPPDQESDDNVNLVKFLTYSVITGIAINLVKNTVRRSGTVLIEKKKGVEI